MSEQSNNHQVNREEYCRRRLAIQRQAVRRVKYTLLAIALLAACWFLFLLWRDSQQDHTGPVSVPASQSSDFGTPSPAPEHHTGETRQ